MGQKDKIEKVLVLIEAIPRGRIATYGQIADWAGLPGRARWVGTLLRTTPDVRMRHWFRVLRADGRIAFPMSSQQFEKQTQLLMQEGVIVKNGRVDLTKFQWQFSLDQWVFGGAYADFI